MNWNLSIRKALAIGFLSLCVSLPGCTLKQGDESIRGMSREDVKKVITIGKSTKTSVSEQFGEPTSKIAGNNGKDEWHYIYKEKEFSALNFIPFAKDVVDTPRATGKLMKVMFNARGVVTDFSVQDTLEQDDAYWGK